MTEQTGLLTSRKQLRIEHKLIQAAQDLIDGEDVLAILRGQTLVSPVVVPLVGPLLAAKPRVVLVTPSFVVTVQQSMWSQSKIVRVVSRHVRGSVPVEVTRLALKIGDDDKIFAVFGSLEAIPEIARLSSLAAA